MQTLEIPYVFVFGSYLSLENLCRPKSSFESSVVDEERVVFIHFGLRQMVCLSTLTRYGGAAPRGSGLCSTERSIYHKNW